MGTEVSVWTQAFLSVVFPSVGPEIHTWRYDNWARLAARARIIGLSVVIKKNTVSNQQSTLVQWCLNFSPLNVA